MIVQVYFIHIMSSKEFGAVKGMKEENYIQS